MTVQEFFKKLIPLLKKKGIKGVYRKFLEKTHVVPAKNQFIYDFDYLVDDVKIPLSEKAYETHKDDEIKILNWVIPEMGKGSGGHLNIFRFVSFLEKMGFHSRIYLFKAPTLHDNESVREFLKDYFPILDERVEAYWDVKYAKFAHATIATSWETAYFVKNFDNTISKFYFVQDYEPFFFPHGSYYELAKNTYRFGFRGITAGDWIKDKLITEFDMKANSFGFSYDKDLYVPLKKKSDTKRVFFYARPVTPRRDFEIGLFALKLLCEKMPEVEVVFAGWDISTFEIPFKYRDMGIMSVDKLSKVYSQCDLCLIISNTNLSLLPLEVMASNSVAVCSKGSNSTWLVNEENAVLVEYEPRNIADTMEYYLTHPDELAEIRSKGLAFAQSTSWEKEAEKVRDALLEGIKEDDK